jgi:hypothetical protein
MQYRYTISILLLVSLAVILAGCTGVQNIPGIAPSGSGTGSSPAPATNNLVPSPTDVLPAQNTVTVDVGEKDYLGSIPVIFQGGMGQIHVKKIEVTLYRSDGQTRTATIIPTKGSEADLEGTKQTDRVVVYISFDNGDRMKVTDVQSPYRTR